MKVLALWILGFIGVYIVIGVLGLAFNLFSLPFFKLQEKVNANRDIIQKTYNADNVIYNYHWFKQVKEDLDATQTKITDADRSVKDFEASAGPREKWTFEDKTEDARLRSVAQGLRSHYNDLAADYNARSKSADQTLFSDQLPLFIGLQ